MGLSYAFADRMPRPSSLESVINPSHTTVNAEVCDRAEEPKQTYATSVFVLYTE